MNRARRSLLFSPGDSLPKITKAAGLGADNMILDLEDGVAPSQRAEARRIVQEALVAIDFGESERLVRVEPVGTEQGVEGIHATLESRPDGYVLPKVEGPADMQAADRLLEEAEMRYDWQSASIRLLPLIETAKAVTNASAIATASERVDALVFGGEDLAAEIGALRTPEGVELLYARSAVVIAASAHKLQAIDSVFVEFRDLDGLEAECQFVRGLGFDGKLAIHPAQVEVINRSFVPSAEEIEKAMRILDAFREHDKANQGAFELDGEMVDKPAARAAERVLERAQIAANTDDS